MPRVWKISAGRNASLLDQFVDRKVVAVGWAAVGDLSNVHGREAIRSLLRSSYENYNRFQLSANAGQLHRFRDELVEGELVLVYDPNKRVYHSGIVRGNYEYHPEFDEHMRHTRAVTWVSTVNRDDLTPQTKNSLGSIATIFCISEAAASEIRGALSSTSSKLLKQSSSEEVLQEEEAEVRQDTEERALEFLLDRLNKLSWTQMQELIAGLLRAMGYRTQVSPPGPDRGRDILASPDGFGFQQPRILVEVKHRKESMGAPEVRAFVGGLRPNDNGLYVSTGGFTREAKYEAERANHHVALMDTETLGRAIGEHYDQMDAETRALLPLRKIYWPI